MSKANTPKNDGYVIFTNSRTKLPPEKRKQIIDVAKQMFAEDFGEEAGMKYSLYDTYETEIEPGELICTSDDYAEIVKAAKLRKAETDGECRLSVMERMDTHEQRT